MRRFSSTGAERLLAMLLEYHTRHMYYRFVAYNPQYKSGRQDKDLQIRNVLLEGMVWTQPETLLHRTPNGIFRI